MNISFSRSPRSPFFSVIMFLWLASTSSWTGANEVVHLCMSHNYMRTHIPVTTNYFLLHNKSTSYVLLWKQFSKDLTYMLPSIDPNASDRTELVLLCFGLRCVLNVFGVQSGSTCFYCIHNQTFMDLCNSKELKLQRRMKRFWNVVLKFSLVVEAHFILFVSVCVYLCAGCLSASISFTLS